MIDLPTPGPLFNPLVDTVRLPAGQVLTALLAGPFGLIAFLPLIPLVLLIARGRRPRGADATDRSPPRGVDATIQNPKSKIQNGSAWRRAALLLGGLAWLLPTLQPKTTAVLLGGMAAATAWIVALRALRRCGRLGQRGMIALVCLGLHILVFPLWWQAQQPWYPSPMAVLHNVGFAYLLLRLIAWGVQLARNPDLPLRLADTICWLLYPPCMRLGPLLLREEFFRRFEAWDARRSPALAAGLQRFGLFVLGVLGIALGGHALGQITQLVPSAPEGTADFFATPERFSTAQLMAAFYLVPVQVYLLLWTYNELACALALWIGIPVEGNFNWLPAATSVRDFWRRWNITLGAWLRDYIYIPLDGNRRHVALNYAAVFGYCGLWHGASWSFMLWAATQALALTVQRGWDRLWSRQGRERRGGMLWTPVCWLLTMHYQAATIVVFCDFTHLGLPLLRELLWKRLLAGVLGA